MSAPASSAQPEGPLFYGQPLIFREKSHRYFWNGEPIPSVTTIINRNVPKQALIQWAADMAVEHVRERLAPGWDVDLVLEGARVAHANIRDAAGDIGTMLHKWAQLIQLGKPFDMAEVAKLPPEDGKRALRVLGALREWYGTVRLGAGDLERRVVSKQFRYAGTTDRFGDIDGHLAVLDYKTGTVVDRKTGDHYPEAWVQLAAYEVALREELGITEPIWHYVIHLDKKTGQFNPYVRGPNETKPAIDAWLGIVECDQRMRALGRSLKRAA